MIPSNFDYCRYSVDTTRGQDPKTPPPDCIALFPGGLRAGHAEVPDLGPHEDLVGLVRAVARRDLDVEVALGLAGEVHRDGAPLDGQLLATQGGLRGEELRSLAGGGMQRALGSCLLYTSDAADD